MRAIMAYSDASVFLNARYRNQFRYTETADGRQVFFKESETAASGNSSRSVSHRCDRTISRKSPNNLEAAALKYPHGMDGYVSRSRLINLLISLRYSLSKVSAPYSGCPWKWTNRLPFFLFTNKSAPALADFVRTR